MDLFFTFLRKGLVATIFVIFGFVATYIPQPFNKVETVEAAGAGDFYTEHQGILAYVEQAGTYISTAASAGFDAITSFATDSEWMKSGIFDGIAWKLAKAIISSMVQSLVDWINSGFSGSPAFVQDLGGFLMKAADEAVGEYISKLGSAGSFICSPFRLDVQISVQLMYEQSRRKDPAPKCSLSGIVGNFEQFIAGDFSEGGWTNWFQITAQPQTMTPLGAAFTAQDGARAAIINAQGEKLAELNFGQGFLSGKICQMVTGTTGTEKECKISKPGAVIVESLNQHLGAGLGSLIAADEINEVIGALLGQIANKAVTGASGLLGLSGGTGHTYAGYSSGSFTGDLSAESLTTGKGAEGAIKLMTNTKATQIKFNSVATTYRPLLLAYSTNPFVSLAKQAQAAKGYEEALVIVAKTNDNSTSIATLISDMAAAQAANDPIKQTQVMSEFSSNRYYSEAEITAAEARWGSVFKEEM